MFFDYNYALLEEIPYYWKVLLTLLIISMCLISFIIAPNYNNEDEDEDE